MTIHYLAMTNPAQLRPSSRLVVGFEVKWAQVPYGAVNRFFYQTVGAAWQWTDRLPWTDEDWQAYAERPGLETWVGYVRGTPAGYFELARQGEGQVEIAMFGLLAALYRTRGGWRLADGGFATGLGRGDAAGVAAHRYVRSPACVGQLSGARDAGLQDRDGVRKVKTTRRSCDSPFQKG